MRGLWMCIGCFAACAKDPAQPGYEFAPDMVRTAAYDSFSPNSAMRDGKTLLTPAFGSVPRGFLPLHYGPGPDEASRAGRELTNPLPSTPATLARGEKVFGVFCSPCHGLRGDGDGPVVPRFPAPPSLHANHARELPDGRMFHIVSRGQGLMPSLAVQVAAKDRWAAVHYVRSLQNPVALGAAP